MKLITRDTDYAVRAVCCIAANKKLSKSVLVLADELDIPRPFLRKILQTLNKKGILKSTKGKGGGFVLAKDPNKITIFNLVEIFQGPFLINEHMFKGKMCPFIKRCFLKKKIDNIEKNVEMELSGITINSLLKEKAFKVWQKEK